MWKKRGLPSPVEEGGCGGGCLGGGRDRFSSYPGRSPLKGATRFGDTISAFSKEGAERPSVRRGTGGPLPAGGSGTSGFGGAAPLLLEKRERAPPPAGRRGHLSWHSARRRATLPAGRAVAPAKRAGGITVFSTAGGLSPRRGQRETGKTGLQITGPAGLCRRCDRVPPHLARRFWLIHPLFPHLCNCATN